MSFLLENWLLVLAALVSGTLLLWPSLSRSRAAGISPTEAVRLINREKAVLIDVCDADEYAKAHAAGSRNVPLASLDSSKALPSNKNLPVVLICASGQRAVRAADTLRKQGFENARALAGGLPAWREANLPIEKAA